jgi:Spy/CpxP family protein refolding chaperone
VSRWDIPYFKEAQTMEKRKHTILTIAVISTLIFLGGWALAYDKGGKRGDWSHPYGYGHCPDLTPEQEEKVRTEQERFFDETADMRREIRQKRLEMGALWLDPKSDPEKIKAKHKEILELQRQFQEKRLDHRLALREILPEEYLGQRGRGRADIGRGGHHGRKHAWGPGYGRDRGERRYCW